MVLLFRGSNSRQVLEQELHDSRPNPLLTTNEAVAAVARMRRLYRRVQFRERLLGRDIHIDEKVWKVALRRRLNDALGRMVAYACPDSSYSFEDLVELINDQEDFHEDEEAVNAVEEQVNAVGVLKPTIAKKKSQTKCKAPEEAKKAPEETSTESDAKSDAKKNPACEYCGRRDHESENCRVVELGFKCHFCGLPGHFRARCKKRRNCQRRA